MQRDLFVRRSCWSLSNVTWLCVLSIISRDAVYCSSQEEEEEDADEATYETKFPYPKPPVEMSWSYEMNMRPHDQPTPHTTIDNFFTKIIEELSYGDAKKMQQLTVRHSWISYKGVNCYDEMRAMLTLYCFDWSLAEHAHRYNYILMNICNAVWLNSEDVEEVVATTCEDKRIGPEAFSTTAAS